MARCAPDFDAQDLKAGSFCMSEPMGCSTVWGMFSSASRRMSAKVFFVTLFAFLSTFF